MVSESNPSDVRKVGGEWGGDEAGGGGVRGKGSDAALEILEWYGCEGGTPVQHEAEKRQKSGLIQLPSAGERLRAR